ncbi:MAG: glutamate racemase [Nitrospirae bacterium RIFCSPLOWO2_02_42_7]|nr:MAG: glutamate racemase [Nitrospirae bacterium RIFCSPLOWO2_02_42_7]OGW59767.1 MAG: glutamate racemase [Nitrospirae bacterium RIFCSPHIGHO2_02_FULL_42_12]HAS16960.1 glutamate racemase [Nitrospiraceae bacterium]
MKNEKRPLGIFDSGIGGLTVLKEIIKLLPEEETLYLGDTARLPYGTKSEETVIKYSIENTRFLLKYNIKLLVVACNTASAVSLPVLRKEFPLPLIGVIEAGARAATKATKNGRIGIIGTETTIRSSAYTKAIKSVNPDITVIGQPCPLFVPLVEEGWLNDDITISVAGRYLTSLRNDRIDTLVLGCTHYPLLKSAIQKVMGDGVRLIDSAEETASEVRELLTNLGLINLSGSESDTKTTPVRRYFVTDVPVRFEEQGSRFLGEKIYKVDKVDLG